MIYDDVKEFYQSYPYRKCVIGYSFCNRQIFAFHVGEEIGGQFISTYAIHGREWITAALALKHIKKGVSSAGGGIIPVVNPDGAHISQTRNPLWKANYRGVDLNCNFDAEWGTGRLNSTVRGAENCIGDSPFSEPETIALKNFTLRVRPYVTLSFHTKGEEIYWEFSGKGDRRGADILKWATGYKPVTLYGSAGGYKDWCIQKLKIPAYTLECGADSLSHPIQNLRKLKKCYGALEKFFSAYGR